MTKRNKSLVFSALIVGVPIVLFLIVNGILVHRSDREVEARLEAIRAAGDPVTNADFPTDADLPPEEDARALLEGVRGRCEAISAFLDEVNNPFSNDPPWKPVTWPPESTDPPRKCADPMPMIRNAAAAKGWRREAGRSRSPLGSDMAFEDDGWEGLDAANLVLHLHYDHCVLKRQWNDAADDMLTVLRLTELYHRAPTYYATQLIALRQRALERLAALLQREDVDPALLDRIEAGLPESPFDETVGRLIKRARVFCIAYARRDSALGNLWLARFLSNQVLLAELDDAEALLKDPGTVRDWASESRAEEASIRGLIARCWDDIAAERTLLRALRILIALKRMKNPDSLVAPDDTLDPTKLDLSVETTTDPHTGKPLIVRKKDSGWLVYGVGPDGTDDLGDVVPLSEGVASRDIGIASPPE